VKPVCRQEIDNGLILYQRILSYPTARNATGGLKTALRSAFQNRHLAAFQRVQARFKLSTQICAAQSEQMHAQAVESRSSSEGHCGSSGMSNGADT